MIWCFTWSNTTISTPSPSVLDMRPQRRSLSQLYPCATTGFTLAIKLLLSPDTKKTHPITLDLNAANVNSFHFPSKWSPIILLSYIIMGLRLLSSVQYHVNVKVRFPTVKSCNTNNQVVGDLRHQKTSCDITLKSGFHPDSPRNGLMFGHKECRTSSIKDAIAFAHYEL